MSPTAFILAPVPLYPSRTYCRYVDYVTAGRLPHQHKPIAPEEPENLLEAGFSNGRRKPDNLQPAPWKDGQDDQSLPHAS